MTSSNRFTSLAVVVIAASTVSAAENWPQWRGPGSQGISTEAALATPGTVTLPDALLTAVTA